MKVEAICTSEKSFSELHVIATQKVAFFRTSAISTSNPSRRTDGKILVKLKVNLS
jgi:hypothetical protein